MIDAPTSGGCACGARHTGTWRSFRAWLDDHGCTLPPQPTQPPLTAAYLAATDEDAAWFDAERDAILDAYDGSPE